MIVRILEQVTFEPTEETELAEQFRKDNPQFREELPGTKALSFTCERIFSAAPNGDNIFKVFPMEGDE